MTTTTTNSTAKVQHPATKALVSALLAECQARGYDVKSLDPATESGLRENAGWCFLRLEGTHEAGASLIIPKAAHRLGKLHSHVDLTGADGYLPIGKPNGKVICHFEPDPAKVAAILPRFLSAAKRATMAATPKATVPQQVVASQPAPVTPVDTTVAPEAITSWADTEEELEAAFQELKALENG